MNKIYNSQEDIASNFVNFLKQVCPTIRKTVLNILPYILIGILNSKSLVATDISKNLKGKFSTVQHESVIKNQKSNGFYLEDTKTASIKYFTTMYMTACIGVLYMTILGADYSKNTRCYKNVKLKTHTTQKGVKRRILSLFNVGLTLFVRAYQSEMYIRISFTFILYDI